MPFSKNISHIAHSENCIFFSFLEYDKEFDGELQIF